MIAQDGAQRNPGYAVGLGQSRLQPAAYVVPAGTRSSQKTSCHRSASLHGGLTAAVPPASTRRAHNQRPMQAWPRAKVVPTPTLSRLRWMGYL